MADIPVEYKTLAQYLQEEELYLQEERDRLCSIYIQRAKDILLKPSFGYTPEEADKIARNVVIHGAKVHSNSINPDGGDEETDNVNQYAQSADRSVLLIKAPTGITEKELKFERDARTHQYKNFLKLRPDLENAQEITVHSYDDMMREIESFIEKEGTRSVKAQVFFNGHGTMLGMRFHNLEKGQEVPINTCIDHIQNVLKEKRSEFGLPKYVDIILCQCYAHLHTPPSADYLKVYALTSEKCAQTRFTATTDSLTSEVTDSDHTHMNRLAKDHEHPVWWTEDHKAEGPSTDVGDTQQPEEEGINEELEGTEGGSDGVEDLKGNERGTEGNEGGSEGNEEGREGKEGKREGNGGSEGNGSAREGDEVGMERSTEEDEVTVGAQAINDGIVELRL